MLFSCESPFVIFFSLVHAVPGGRPARQTCGKECNAGAIPAGRARRLTVIRWRRLSEPQCRRYAECGLEILRYPAQRRTEGNRL